MPRKSTAPNVEKREGRNDRVAIGRRVAKRRMSLGMSQATLAEKFGVGRGTLSHYEAGLGDFNAGDMTFMAEILGVPVSYLFLEPADDRSKERIEQIVAYLPLLPLPQQDIIANMVIDSYGQNLQQKREVNGRSAELRKVFGDAGSRSDERK